MIKKHHKIFCKKKKRVIIKIDNTRFFEVIFHEKACRTYVQLGGGNLEK